MSATWRVRSARNTKKDRALLEAFSCADRAFRWQAEVEDFICAALFDWAFEPLAKPRDPRLLLTFVRSTMELVGVAAHERVTLQHRRRARFAATKLEVVAIARRWQGQMFEPGVRASDVIMSAVMADIEHRVPPRHARVFAVVHEDNVRSIALARRYGFVEELSRPHPSYRRLLTGHRG